MKCDKLEIKYVGYGMGFYPTEDVDAAIAELKDKCQMHDFFWEGCGFSKMGFKNTTDVANYVDNLKAEIEKLKESNANLEHACDRIETACAETQIELRATNRALWLAREWRAWCEGQYWFFVESDKPRDIYHLLCTNRIHRTPNEWMTYWHKVEQLCKKEADK